MASLELGWGRGTTVPQQSCQASLQLGGPQADVWRQWKLQWHRKHPNEGPCITACCSASPDRYYFILGMLSVGYGGRSVGEEDSVCFSPSKSPQQWQSLQSLHQAACKVPTKQWLTLTLAPHSWPWEQRSHVPPAAREWAEMGCGHEQAAEPLTARLSGQMQHRKWEWKPVNTN